MRIMKKFLFILFFILIACRGIYAQDIKVTAAFDSTRILIGDQVNFTITVEKPSGQVLNIPQFRDTLIKNIEILKGPLTDSIAIGQDRVKITEKYLVTSFDSGYYKLDPVYAEVRSSSGINRFYSDYSRLEVMKYKVAPADSTAKIYDIVAPYKAPMTFNEILPWIIGSLIVVAAIWVAIAYYKRFRKKSEEVHEIINPDPAHIIAFRDLERLKSEELWQKGHTKLYYTRLTEILRQYLENRYRIYSLELTTPETMQALLKTGFRKGESFTKLKNVLTAADLVKFAKHVPDADEMELHFLDAWNFVEVTKEIQVITEPVETSRSGKEAEA
jgi:hypothetical protein